MASPGLPTRRAAASLACIALLIAGCGGTGPSPTATAPSTTGSPGSSPGGSSSAACPAAPAPPASVPGWEPPATAPTVVPLIIASPGQLVCGPNRVLFTLLDGSGRSLSAPDVIVKVALYELGRDPGAPIATTDSEFVWAIENERGIYVTNVVFPESGSYGAEFTISGGSLQAQAVRVPFDVQPASAVVKVGDRAPASRTPTLADVGGDPRRLSTDAEPLKAFYETSVDQALAKHEPFVLVFATPKFCTSGQCGPTLDRIKPYVSRYPSVTFINVEPYKLKLVDGSLEADLDAGGQLQNVPATDEWHLFNEPSVYVVDDLGIVTANFELIFSDTELSAALNAVK